MTPTNSCFIIAEAGVNHNGDLVLAKRLVDAAKRAGADAVKFQTFQADLLVTPKASKASYQIENTSHGSQYEMLKKLELDVAAHQALMEHCSLLGIQFLSAPFDIPSIALLEQLKVSMLKIPSGEITDLPYLRAIASYKKNIILSTGMSTLFEVKSALEALVKAGQPQEKISLLHCTTEYPAPFEEVNLRAMLTLKQAFGLPVGYSDHTRGVAISIAAVALGASIIEKHLTLDKTMEGPDHKASLDPQEFVELVQAIRHVEQSLGDGQKVPSASEMKNLLIARKSLVASRPIEAGEVFSEDNITAKRSGVGLSPMRWDDLMGARSTRTYRIDEAIIL